jgi:putative ABC transport system permease protein
MRDVWHDLRYAVRMLVKRRWYTLAAMTALALGIGANTAVFTLVNVVLLQGLPFDRSDRIVALGMQDPRPRNFGVSSQDFDDWRRGTRTIPDLSAAFGANLAFSGDDRAPEQYAGVYMSASGFALTGSKPVIGRLFSAEDDRVGAPAVVVLGNDIWKNRYGSDRSVLGKKVRVQALDVTIIGVMPPDMKFPFNSEAWLPLAQLPPAVVSLGRGNRQLFVFGTLPDGVTLEQARTEFTTISRELARQYPTTNKDLTATVEPFLNRFIGGPIRLIFWSLMGAVAFVLLIACSNVANLLLAQAADRAREIAVRVSLGATRWRIVRQLLVESVLLSLVSGIAGLGLAQLGIKWFDMETQGVGKPYWMIFRMDPRAFVFFVGVSVLSGILFGLMPALHISKTNLNEVLKEGGRSGGGGARSRRWAGALVVTQVTLTLVLLAGAGFMMRSFLILYRMDAGFDSSRLLTMQLLMPARKYVTPADRSAFLKRVDERVSTAAAVESATTTSNWPYGGGAPRLLAIEGRTLPGPRAPSVTIVSTGPRYFDTLGVRLIRGRALTESDGVSQQSVVVNRRLAEMYFPGENPVGRRIQLTEEFPTGPQTGWFTVVGISPNIRQRDFQEPDPDPVAYVPHIESPGLGRGVSLLVRTRVDPAKATAAVREEVRAIDADMPLFNIRTMEEQLAQLRWPYRVFGAMFTMFALIALILSAVGLYAVTAYSVTQRTQEIGVRMALGAPPESIRWLILRRALIQLSIGLIVGIGGAFAVGRLLRSMLVQIPTADPVTLTTIVAILIVIAITACLAPSRRATRLDPSTALRYE